MLSPQKASIAEESVAKILQLIRECALAPGSRLPSERQLALQLKVSRTSIRAALGRLVTIGWLEAHPGKGTFVKEPSSTFVALAPHIFTHSKTLQQLFELREMIEVEAVARAAIRATPAHIAMMHDWVTSIESSVRNKEREKLVRADFEFHRQIVLATGNDVLVNLYDSIADLLHEMRYASTYNLELLPSQRAILAAIESGNSDTARQAMLEHLKMVRIKAEAFLQKGKKI